MKSCWDQRRHWWWVAWPMARLPVPWLLYGQSSLLSGRNDVGDNYPRRHKRANVDDDQQLILPPPLHFPPIEAREVLAPRISRLVANLNRERGDGGWQ